MYCENVPSSRSPWSEIDDNEVERAELRKDQSSTDNSEMVDVVGGADTTSDHEQDEEKLWR